VYEPAAASVTLVLPLAASEPDQPSPVVPPLAVQLLVSVEFQVSVKDWPVLTVAALADMLAVDGCTTDLPGTTEDNCGEILLHK
jgi:hypothetical protein